ncbi:hypothetical protein FHR90_002194 [Endobacter medicaginis]|uniref:DUF4169 family protein n=2 Tax=Endobacter medicaginis TaxID=1181271 RepID=A0A839V0Z9_9PROT|nr:DUF4169 family protein [Endobacter medicaginis]MBB3174353.1 hypothetical protein [Endobacter medicaginis]MCX5476703.1 DUF4169 family protein [Endobacter medicaginis]
MADIINLRRHRKARARAAESAEADANRAKFGRTRAERDRAQAETAGRDRLLDGARVDADTSFAPGSETD